MHLPQCPCEPLRRPSAIARLDADYRIVSTVLRDCESMAEQMSSETFLTVGDVAARLSIHRQTVLRWLRSGELRGVRLGGTKSGWRIAESDLADFLRRRYEAGRV
jgi:excisionase family DNA binding protein